MADLRAGLDRRRNAAVLARGVGFTRHGWSGPRHLSRIVLVASDRKRETGECCSAERCTGLNRRSVLARIGLYAATRFDEISMK